MYNPVSFNTRAIYNVLIDNKQTTPSCIEKWSEDYPGFHTAQKTCDKIYLDNHSVSIGKPNCKYSNIN